MSVPKIVAGAVLCILSSQVSWAQQATSARGNEALGYFDYSTGAFRPLAQKVLFDSDSLAAANPQTGTIVVNFTITIKSAFPATYLVNCGVDATVSDISGAGINIISEAGSVVGTRTGSTAKCTVTIPYSWMVLSPSTATLDLRYTVSAGKATATTGILLRSSSGGIATIPLPANGSTTTQTVNAVL